MEIEIKLNCTKEKYNEINDKMIKESKLIKNQNQIDIYYNPEGQDFFKDKDKCLRMRIDGNKTSVDYKQIYFGAKEEDTYLDEFVVNIDNSSSMIDIFKKIGIKEVLRIDKKRTEYIYKDIFIISLDLVKDLGYFIEVEIKSKENKSVEEVNNSLIDTIKELGLNIEDRNTEGYSNLMYKKIIENK